MNYTDESVRKVYNNLYQWLDDVIINKRCGTKILCAMLIQLGIKVAYSSAPKYEEAEEFLEHTFNHFKMEVALQMGEKSNGD